MENTNVAPINHGLGSATVTTAVEAGKGGVRGATNWGLVTGLGVIALGALIGLTGGLAGVAIGAAIAVIPAIGVGLLGAGFGSVFGLANGTAKGVNRVSQEQGAANVIQAQVAVSQAQSMGAAMENKYNLPAQGSAMNPAGSTINSFQSDGRIDGLQLQRA